MANETELSNFAIPTDVVSDAIAQALVQKVVALPRIYSEDLPVGTNLKKFRKDGSLTAEEIAESASYSFSSSSELTQSSVNSTATKFVCVSKLSVEAQQFAGVTPAMLYQKQGEAIARDLDDEILALASGLSTSVTATNVLTVNDIMTAVYNVQNGTQGVSSGVLDGLFDYKGVMEIRKELLSAGAAVFSQPQQTSLLAGTANNSGFVGSLPGVNIYQTNGLPTTGGDDIAIVFDPALAFASVYGGMQNRASWKGSEGFFDELSTFLFFDVIEWNDAAGCGVRSDT
jgi:hypothetical protein